MFLCIPLYPYAAYAYPFQPIFWRIFIKSTRHGTFFIWFHWGALHILHVAGCYTVLYTRCRHFFGEIEMIGMGHEKVSGWKCKKYVRFDSRTVSALFVSRIYRLCKYFLRFNYNRSNIESIWHIFRPSRGKWRCADWAWRFSWLILVFFWRRILEVAMHVPSRNWFYEWWHTNVVNQKKSHATSGVKTL